MPPKSGGQGSDHAGGPAINRVGSTVKVFPLGLEMIPEGGFKRSEEKERAEAGKKVIGGIRVKPTEDIEMQRVCAFLDDIEAQLHGGAVSRPG